MVRGRREPICEEKYSLLDVRKTSCPFYYYKKLPDEGVQRKKKMSPQNMLVTQHGSM
jgi:hypothetical protein